MKISTLVLIIFLVASMTPVSGQVRQSAIETPAPAQIQTTASAIEMPDFNADLRDYYSEEKCNSSGFLGPCKPEKYIIPENKIVRYAASFLEIKESGKLYWIEPNPFKERGIFYNNYVTDDEQFNYPPNSDYWVNPDYYLLNGLSGDCEDSVLAVASVLEARGIRTKIVGGYLTYDGKRLRDWVAEYRFNGTYYRYFGAAVRLGFISRDNFEQYKRTYNVDFEPVLMFDKSTNYMDYVRDW